MTKTNKKTAFTLAEVLITLAIIGVVAVLTVPTLITNNQEKGWNTASTVFEAKLEQALKVMNTQGTLAGYRTTKDFVDELSNHLKIVKVCDSDKLTDCFSDKVYWDVIDISKNGTVSEEVDVSNVKTAADLGQDDWGTEVLGFQLNNGTNGLIAYNPTNTCHQDQFSNQITGTSCIAVLYDTSGFSKPNTSGKDMRAINAQLSGKCAFKSGSTCFGTPFEPTAHFWKGCDINGETTNEEDLAFMSKHGIKSCLRISAGRYDYWAGAVETCGGTNKMATASQLIEIANYIYNTDKVQDDSHVEDLTMDMTKVSELGFFENTIAGFVVLSGDEVSNYFMSARSFSPISTGLSSAYPRQENYYTAVCIK